MGAERSLVLSLIVSALMAGCVKPDSVVCDNGLTCPAGDVCAMIGGKPICATEDQVTQCAGMPDGTTCTSDTDGDGACHDGVCALVSCGNGLVDPGETCDDGNNNSGDLCSADCQSTEACGNGVLDPVVIVNGVAQLNETCDDGNLLSHDGCSSQCQPEKMAWSDISLQRNPVVTGPSLAFDTVRERFVLFGGMDPNTSDNASLQGTWESADGIAWRKMLTPVAPSPRGGAAMAYDPIRRRTVLHGGTGPGATLGDVWEWDGQRWQDVTPDTGGPGPHSRGSMAYDPGRMAVVLWGGDGDETKSDTWTWDGTTWTELPPGPGARFDAKIAYDPVRGAIVLGPGESQSPSTWELDAAGWHLREQGAPTGLTTNNSGGVVMAYDPGSQHVIAHVNQVNIGESGQVIYAWDGSTWTVVQTSAPNSMFGAMASDPAHGVVVYIGWQFVCSGTCQNVVDAWRYTANTWTKGKPPTAATFGTPIAAAYATQTRTLVMVTDSATVELANDHWRVLPPPATTGCYLLMTYDSARDEVVLLDVPCSGSPTTFVYTQGLWTERSTPVAPPGAGAMTYDAAHGRTVLLAGDRNATTPPSETWFWDGAQWTQGPSGTDSPPFRTAAAMSADPIRGQVVLFGGRQYLGDNSLTLGDTWVWDGASWTEVTPTRVPASRTRAATVWNPIRRAIEMIGGENRGEPLGDTWEWNGSGWTLLGGSIPARYGAFAFPTEDQESVRVYGGNAAYPSNWLEEIWQLRIDDDAEDERCELVADADGDTLAGCADPDCFAVCDPTCSPGMTCSTPRPTCGDGTCEISFETCHSCPDDCTACSSVACGDNFCDPSETTANCPGDCPP